MSFLKYIGLGLGFREQHEPQKKKFSNLKNSFAKGKIKGKIILCEPTDFSGIVRFVGLLRENRPVIVNFRKLSSNIERGLDFVCGAVCVLNGTLERIGSGVYFYAPPSLLIEKN
jgi:cell division inhibitor SepF